MDRHADSKNGKQGQAWRRRGRRKDEEMKSPHEQVTEENGHAVRGLDPTRNEYSLMRMVAGQHQIQTYFYDSRELIPLTINKTIP